MRIRQLYIPSTVIMLLALSYALFSNIPKTNTVSANQPNVILIMLDDLGYGYIQAHGNPYLKTPHLDRLHGESVRFTNFHVDPSCSPSRAAILTGQYSSRSGVWNTIGGRSLLQKDKIAIDTHRFRIEDGEKGEDVQINKAHLAIENLEKEVAVMDAMTSSTFTVQLKPGETALKAWFSGGKKYGANYVKIHYIEPAVFIIPLLIRQYIPTNG